MSQCPLANDLTDLESRVSYCGPSDLIAVISDGIDVTCEINQNANYVIKSIPGREMKSSDSGDVTELEVVLVTGLKWYAKTQKHIVRYR